MAGLSPLTLTAKRRRLNDDQVVDTAKRHDTEAWKSRLWGLIHAIPDPESRRSPHRFTLCA